MCLLQLLLFCVVPFAIGQPQIPLPTIERPDETRCVDIPSVCSAFIEPCSTSPIERTTDLCYLARCCDSSGEPRFGLAPATTPPGFFATEAISVRRFVASTPSINEPVEAPWSLLNKADAMCNFRWEGNDNRVDFVQMPKIARALPLIATSWSRPTQPLLDPALTVVAGFQLNVYMLSDASKPACMIESFRLGNASTEIGVEFPWRQYIVTDSDARMRRYVYRWYLPSTGPVNLTPFALADPPTFSMVITRSDLNGTCWLDCVEFQLLFVNQNQERTLTTTTTTSAVTIVRPSPSPTPTPSTTKMTNSNEITNTNTSTSTSTITNTSVSASAVTASEQQSTMSMLSLSNLNLSLSDDDAIADSDALVIGLAAALGTVVLLVVVGLVAFAVRRRRSAKPATSTTSATSAATPTSPSARDNYQSFSSQRQEYDNGNIESIHSLR
jgi:hypothetical protein